MSCTINGTKGNTRIREENDADQALEIPIKKEEGQPCDESYLQQIDDTSTTKQRRIA